MSYEIVEECIACGACESECPVDAIAPKDNIYVVDATACIDCGACAGVCPVEAARETSD